jgi:uncharacterized protein
LNVEHNQSTHRFEVKSGGEVAFLEYRLEGGAIALLHTKVPPPLEGQGVASALASAAFDYARSHQLRVTVICPYVAKWLEKHPEHRDLVE